MKAVVYRGSQGLVVEEAPMPQTEDETLLVRVVNAGFCEIYPQMAIPIPEGVDSRNAAMAETFAAALHGINTARNQGGSVLVMGGGPIGLAAVRLLKLLGFTPTVLSEPMPVKRELGRL